MPISPSDIKFRYSNSHASGANNDSSIPPTSDLATRCIGKWISTIEWTGGTPNDLFDDISGARNYGNSADYRCIFVVNLNSTLTLYNAYVYIPSQITGGTNCSISVENSTETDGLVRVVQISSSTQQAIVLTTSSAVPNDSINGWETNFSSADGVDNAISIGDIPPNQCAPIWIKRQAVNSSPLNSDGFSIIVAGDGPE